MPLPQGQHIYGQTTVVMTLSLVSAGIKFSHKVLENKHLSASICLLNSIFSPTSFLRLKRTHSGITSTWGIYHLLKCYFKKNSPQNFFTCLIPYSISILMVQNQKRF